MKKTLLMLISLSFICGCQFLPYYHHGVYESAFSVEKGTYQISEGGLFSARVPEEGLTCRKKGKYAIEFLPKQSKAMGRGIYALRAFEKENIPDDGLTDLKRFFLWVNQAVIFEEEGVQAVLLKTRETSFKGKPALYLEYFFPTQYDQVYDTLQSVRRSPYCVTALILFKDDLAYWFSYSDPARGGKYPFDDFTITMRDDTRQRFFKLLEGIVFLEEPAQKKMFGNS